jgi:hypothetical protein
LPLYPLILQVKGQYWTLDYTSTFKSDGAVCPASEYPDLLVGELDDLDNSGASSFLGLLSVSALFAATVAIAL